MSAIELRGVAKRYGDTPALREVSFTAAEGEFLVLLGPSGCGKSTTLRLIAGLESVTRGRILIGGEDITQCPPAQRRLSMVFQSYALFPHLDVAENIQFGLKVRKVPARERAERLAQVAELVGLGELLARKPAQLSGGQRQRVALARAIIAQHPVCLMDEPLSNLDAKLRHEMRIEIRALQRKLGMTVIYVTHDQTEAMSMADKVLLMRNGRVEQEGAPEVLYAQPRSIFTAEFIGSPPMNILDPLACGLPAGGVTHAPLPAAPADCRVGIRPEAIRLAEAGLPARLLGADYLGADSIVLAHAGERSIVVRVPGHRHVGDGEFTHLSWSLDAVHLFDRDSGMRIEP